MPQIYQYAVAALFIEAVIIFFYFQKRSLPTFQNLVFLVILNVVTMNNITELSAVYMECNISSLSVRPLFIVNCLYFTFNVTFGILFAIYNLSAFDVYGKLNKRAISILKLSLLLPYFFLLVIIWLSWVLSDSYVLLFTIDPIIGYKRGSDLCFYGYCVIKAFYILFSFIIILCHHRHIPKTKMQVIYFFLVTISSTSLLQLFNNGLLIESFGMALVTLVYFFFIQKPEEMMDASTETLNHSALQRMLRYNLAIGHKFTK